MDLLQALAVGAEALAAKFGGEDGKWTRDMARHGFTKEEWELLTQPECWNEKERRSVRSLLGEAINLSMTMAGMPAAPLPAHYVAAVISKLVHPCNRLVAAQRAPEAYNALSATGQKQAIEVEMVPQETMIALVMAYSSGVVHGINVPIRSLYGEQGDDEAQARKMAAE